MGDGDLVRKLADIGDIGERGESGDLRYKENVEEVADKGSDRYRDDSVEADADAVG